MSLVKTPLILAMFGFYAALSAAQTAPKEVSNVVVPVNRNLEIGMSQQPGEVSGVAALTFSGEPVGIRVVIDKSSKSEHGLISAGFSVSDNGYLVGGRSIGKEPIPLPGVDERMEGKSAFIRLDITNLAPEVRKIFVDILAQKTKSKVISVSDSAFVDVDTVDFGDFLRTTTVDGVNRTTVEFFGGKLLRFVLGGEANVNDNGILVLKLLHTRTNVLSESTQETKALVGYKHYFLDERALLGLSVDSKGEFLITGEKSFKNSRFGLTMNGFKDTRGAKNYGFYAGLRYSFGDEQYNAGVRPDTANAQMSETLLLNTLYNPKDYFGRIIRKQEKIITGQAQSDVTKPAQPAAVAPIVDTVVPVNAPPTDIAFSQMACPDQFNPAPSAIDVGTLSCTDVAPGSGAANSCTFSGGNSAFSVSSSGVLSQIVGTVPDGLGNVNITATDANSGVYSKPIAVNLCAAISVT